MKFAFILISALSLILGNVSAYNMKISHRSSIMTMRSTGNLPQRNVDNMKKSINKVLQFAPLISLIPLSANAGLFSSQEQDDIDEISKFQRPVNDLLDQLKPANVPNSIGVYSNTVQLKGGKEDSDVVRNYMEVYIKPLQIKMEKLAPKLKLDNSENLDRIKVLPALMKGHIFELTQAIDEMKSSSQLKEVEEVQETLAEFLKIASITYKVTPYIPIRPLNDAELFGPLGCEFWGKKRVPGSNACTEVPKNP